MATFISSLLNQKNPTPKGKAYGVHLQEEKNRLMNAHRTHAQQGDTHALHRVEHQLESIHARIQEHESESNPA